MMIRAPDIFAGQSAGLQEWVPTVLYNGNNSTYLKFNLASGCLALVDNRVYAIRSRKGFADVFNLTSMKETVL